MGPKIGLTPTQMQQKIRIILRVKYFFS